jgi:hypothetical protein
MVVVLVMIARTALLAKLAEAMVNVTGRAANMEWIVVRIAEFFTPRGLN